MASFAPRVSKLPIYPVDRSSLLQSIVLLEKSNGQILHRHVLSLKDICTRRLLLFFGDDHPMYQTSLPSKLFSYVTYDYFIETNNVICQETIDQKKFLCCRDCSVNDLGASKCRRRKCFAYRSRFILNQLSQQMIPWDEQRYFSILPNDDDDDDNPIVFLSLKSKHSKDNRYQWIKEQFYLLDLLRILQINIFRE